MHTDPLPVVVLPHELSDETAAQLLDLLHQIARVIEHHYAAQIQRHHQTGDDRQPDLWDDQDPPF